jgi:predicted nucleotidyltransferase
MTPSQPLNAPQLPAPVQEMLGDFLRAAQSAFGAELISVVLYGSAAEGKLRVTSDVNLMLVLASFTAERADPLRGPLRLAQSAIQLRPMFLLQSEIPAASRSFASKFADILRRRVILHGEDPFAALAIPRDVQVRQLRQQLLNQILRLRAAYVARSLREEQLDVILAQAIGPLRSASAALLELQGKPTATSQAAFEIAGSEHLKSDWPAALASLSCIQESRLLPSGQAKRIYFQILDLTCHLHSQASALSTEPHP